jgi:hypothetical protein
MNSDPQIAVVEKRIKKLTDELADAPGEERSRIAHDIETLEILAANLKRLQSTIH